MGTRGYKYNQIRIRIHIMMDNQIPIRARDGFYRRIPVGMSIFTTPKSSYPGCNIRD